MLCASAAQASAVSPLPTSDYTVQSVCAAPAPGHAGCLAQLLVAETAAARAYTHPLGVTRSHLITAAKASEGVYGLRPQDLRGAYFPGEQPDAPILNRRRLRWSILREPNAETDLEVYDHEFSLPRCTEANGCFKKVNQEGETGDPPITRAANGNRKKPTGGRSRPPLTSRWLTRFVRTVISCLSRPTMPKMRASKRRRTPPRERSGPLRFPIPGEGRTAR